MVATAVLHLRCQEPKSSSVLERVCLNIWSGPTRTYSGKVRIIAVAQSTKLGTSSMSTLYRESDGFWETTGPYSVIEAWKYCSNMEKSIVSAARGSIKLKG